jgi:hypothetical protein
MKGSAYLLSFVYKPGEMNNHNCVKTIGDVKMIAARADIFMYTRKGSVSAMKESFSPLDTYFKNGA